MKNILKNIILATTICTVSTAAVSIESTQTDKKEAQEMVKDFDFTFDAKHDLVAYYSYRGKKLPDIFIRNNHDQETNLTKSDDMWDIEPDFSPDGRKIIYSSGPDMGSLDLRLMAPDGSHDMLFYDSDLSVAGASWSPDGKHVLFAEFDRASGVIDILVADDHGRHVRNLTSDIGGSASGASWSHDGKYILFVHEETDDSPSDIYVMAADGSHKTRLTHDGGMKMGPIQSPDGKLVLFAGTPENGKSTDIFAFPIHGMKATGHTVNLTNTPDLAEYFLSYTPNGAHLVYSQGSWANGFSLAHMASPRTPR